MAKQNIATITRVEIILAKAKRKVGTYPGQNRSRKFKNKKKEANRRACRGRVSND